MRRTHVGPNARWGGRAIALIAMAAAAPPIQAQSIAQRVSRVRDGDVRMSFATRPGVCGHGRNIMTFHDTDDWEGTCSPGPARVVLTFRGGALVDVDVYVGGRWRPARDDVVDLGTVPAASAAEYLLTLASQTTGHAGKEAILPATLADSAEVWPDLLRIAKDRDLPPGTRKAAVFWLGQAAGEEALGELTSLIDDDNADRDLQEQAVFALSQLRHDEGLPALIEIARNHRDRRVRRRAMFWLGQSDDPRVIALFEEILLHH
ncbi:MAG TPA: HEAT repeat domain-containing protein [Gemmatimonadales bacterium]